MAPEVAAAPTARAPAPAPSPAPSSAPPPARAPWRLLLLLGLCAFALRAVRLSADPPAAMPEATPMDEGLWADAARGKLFFDDWWADDTGNAILIAPLHSVVLYGLYSLFGVGLWQTRLPSAVASALLCVVLGLVAHRALGPRGLLLTGALLACSPLLDQHGRMGLLESEQMFWIACAFALLFSRLPPP